MIIDYKFINSLYKFKFPKICHEQCCLNCDYKLTEFGKKLKNFENLESFSKKLENLKDFNKKLHTNYSDGLLVEHLSNFEKLLLEQRDNIIKSSFNYLDFNKLAPIFTLTFNNSMVWGCKRQYLYGYVCSKIFENNSIKISPILCSILNPTGGICGPSNNCLYIGKINNFITIHSSIHDASGYCYNYHNIGMGYNYLNTLFAFPTHSPMSCQIIGLLICFLFNI